ncbi:hypothetical protein LWI28_019475 [Acer negundo]|uniref:Protein kinase domain-containing protein n=1 Tax=Acer negundo TaxID=4023 RepID=A0AAD5P4J8_ACENE|nr:hypothetical protein LWI28_019475 [Acer negundo]
MEVTTSSSTSNHQRKQCLPLVWRKLTSSGSTTFKETSNQAILARFQHGGTSGDFGLAKALVESYDSNTESSLWFAGSYGYIAPEYAYSFKATEKCDVYSLGIVLMELVTGKMPTDDTFACVDMDMVRWVETHIEMAGSSLEDLISEQLKPLFPAEECAAYQVLEIALQCTKPLHRRDQRPGKFVISSCKYLTTGQ